MLYETLNQPYIMLLFLLFGFLSGFIFDFNSFSKMFLRNKIFQNISIFFCTIITIFIFYICNLSLNYGQFRIYLIICFLISFTLQRIIFNKIVAKLTKKCYDRLKNKGTKWKIKKKKKT